VTIGWLNQLAVSSTWSAALNAVALGVTMFAAVHSWRSANNVVRQNRPWTRAWRLGLVLFLGLTINGVIVPLGAVYALAVYKVPARRGTRIA
jgi:hypothetical protein